jgi:hypothetical protein
VEPPSPRSQIWGFRDVALGGLDLIGFDVEATDGPVGKVDDATNDVRGSRLVVDTRSRVFGRKVLVPAEAVARVDAGNGVIFLDRARDEIKGAPTYRAGREPEATDETVLAYHGAPAASRTGDGELAAPR